MGKQPEKRRYAAVKRAFDFIGAGVVLIVLLPLILVLALMVGMTMGSPVVFQQTRPGLDGRPFTMFKFRSMSTGAVPDGQPTPDAERLGKFGRFLRATSLDELPELWNVLAGDMSLVGPRPLLPAYLPLYTRRQARRHEIKPGITGWAQINGRNALSWEEKFELDVWYVDNRSFALDLKILWLTVWRVIAGANISRDGHATMPPFTGSGESQQ